MRACKLLLIPVGILSLFLFVAIARSRFIDPDEGFYLLASRLVFQHKLPYIDFFYTQTPFLPYVYGLWMQAAGESWLSARVFSACLTSALGILVYVQVCSHTRKWASGLLAFLLFTANSLVFAWMPIAKTYALSSLLLFASYVISSRFSGRSSKATFVAAALLLGLSVEVRLYFVAVLPLFLLSIFRNPDIREKKAAISCFAGGFLIAMLPSLYLLYIHPDSYVFNNLGIHAIRSSPLGHLPQAAQGSGLIGDVGLKFIIVLCALFISPIDGHQLAVLYIAGIAVLLKTRAAARPSLAFELAAALSLLCLLPTPTYFQYFCVVIPFLIVALVCAFDRLLSSLQRERARLSVIAGFALLAIYLAAPIKNYRNFLITGDGLGVPSGGAVNWSPEMVLRVSKTIDQLADPGEKVMSFWPGYVFGTKAAPFPGFENDSGLPHSALLSDEQRSKYHIVCRSQIEAQIAARIPRIVVLGNQEYWRQSKQPYAEVLLHSGYHVAAVIGDTSIYIL